MAKFWWKSKSSNKGILNKGILSILAIFLKYEISISLEYAINSDWNGAINFVVACPVVELLIHRNHKI